jgi:1,4-dihydroxy-2-naphthoate octaprenyltransferase
MKSEQFKRLWKGFWQLADPKIWVASTIPMAVGGALAFGMTGKFDVFWFVVSLAAVYLIEIGKNASNEVVDYITGVDRYVTPDKRTPFSGGKKTIVDGKLTVTEAVLIAMLTFGLACIIGIYIILFRELSIFWIGFIGVLTAIFYSVPPVKLAYRGLGEIAVGFVFGPLILSGIYKVMTHGLVFPVIVASLPIGLLIANVLIINQFPDYEADTRGNKKNLVVRLGKKKAINVYAMLYILAFSSFLAIAIIFKNPLWLLGFAGVPLAIKSVRVARVHYDNIKELMQANAATIMVYQVTGLAMVIAAISQKYV